MSIKLRFEKGSLITQVVLKDEALAPLLDIVAKHQADEPPSAPGAPAQSATTAEKSNGFQPGDRSSTCKTWLRQHSGAEALNLFNWQTNPEKILLMGAIQESNQEDDEAWRSADMEKRFAESKEGFPANFPRDISAAIKDGLIATVTPRTYRVSRYWLEQAFRCDSQDHSGDFDITSQFAGLASLMVQAQQH